MTKDWQSWRRQSHRQNRSSISRAIRRKVINFAKRVSVLTTIPPKLPLVFVSALGTQHFDAAIAAAIFCHRRRIHKLPFCSGA
jgi:hypothetical protein